MTTRSLSYPLLCWTVSDDAVFGCVPGTEFQGLERNLKRLKSSLGDALHRAWERDQYVPAPEMDAPRLKLATVLVHLSYRTAKGSFPVSTPTPFKVAAVYGSEADTGDATCYLPYLDESFHYFDESQLPVLIEHYTRDRLDGLSPEQAQRYLMTGTPWLETLTLRRQVEPAATHVPRHLREACEQLSTLADPLPETGARRPPHGFPEVAWEQGALVDELAARLVQGGHLLLVGETGVGKSVVIQDAIRKAHRQIQAQAPAAAATFWRSNAERLIGRAKYLGEWQAWCDQALDWLDMVHGVLWVTDFVNLLHVGGGSPEDSVAAYLLPAVRRGSLRLIGEAHPTELETARRLLPAFMECFEPEAMPEMDPVRSRRVLHALAHHAEQGLGVTIEPPALETGYRLLKRYTRYERFPGKAVRFFGDCVRQALAERSTTLTETGVLQRFAKQSGLPELFLRDDRPLADDEVERFFAPRVLGQPAAIEHLKDVVCTFKAGLNDDAKPMATLLLVGPTGVGKTAAAKALAAFFFGAAGEPPLLRLDMSEFQHAFQVARLIGQGDRPGPLIEQVRQKPFSVILLDEIEKADPAVFDVLLSVLDEGRLRDSRGRETDFRNTIILMTSNLGTRAGASLGFTEAPGDTALHDVRRFFRPEFFNRIDRVVPFAPLTREAIEAIAGHELAAIASREGLARRGISLHFTPALRAWVASIGFSPVYGARPLQRAIEQRVVAAVARALFGPVPDGARLQVDVRDGAVHVDPHQAE
jgi:ATP-dependent Clp protease ATP-binding subunit ClpC